MKKPLQPPLIRIIDDDAQALEAVDFMLKCEGYSTVAYSSAAEFLVDDIPSRPGCLLSDIRMPDMMGTELFDELLNRNYPHPVLFMTAFGDIESAVTAMKKGAVDYLVKPVAAEKLFAGVVNALKIDRKRREGLVGSPFWSDRWVSLTDREREVVKLVAKDRLPLNSILVSGPSKSIGHLDLKNSRFKRLHKQHLCFPKLRIRTGRSRHKPAAHAFALVLLNLRT